MVWCGDCLCVRVHRPPQPPPPPPPPTHTHIHNSLAHMHTFTAVLMKQYITSRYSISEFYRAVLNNYKHLVHWEQMDF